MSRNDASKEALKARIKSGDTAFTQEKYEEAIRCFDKALFLDPMNGRVYISKAKAFKQLCDFKSSIVNYRKAFRLIRSSELAPEIAQEFAALLDLQGYKLLLENEYAAALPLFNEAISLNPISPNYRLHRVLTYIGLESWRKALKDCDQCLAIDTHSSSSSRSNRPRVSIPIPDEHHHAENKQDVNILILRAKLKWKLGHQQKGNEDITLAFQVDPKHPEVLLFERRLWCQAQDFYDQACQAILQKDFHQALSLINGALALSSHDQKLYCLRASCWREMGAFNEAMKDIETVTNMGAAISMKLSTAEAAEAAQDLEQRKMLILNDQAIELMHVAKDYESALRIFNEILKDSSSHYPIDYRIYINRGDCYRALGKRHAARADYHHAMENGSPRAMKKEILVRLSMIHYAEGLHLFNRGQLDQAEIELGFAIETGPGIAQYYLRRGDAAYYQNKLTQAFVDYTKAGSLDPTNITVQLKLSQFSNVKTSSSIGSPVPAPAAVNQLKQKPRLPSNILRAKHSVEKQNQRMKYLLSNSVSLSTSASFRK